MPSLLELRLRKVQAARVVLNGICYETTKEIHVNILLCTDFY